jgi:hypothetical protein
MRSPWFYLKKVYYRVFRSQKLTTGQDAYLWVVLGQLVEQNNSLKREMTEYKKKFGEQGAHNQGWLSRLVAEQERQERLVALLSQNVATLEAALGYNSSQELPWPPQPKDSPERQVIDLKETHGLQSDQSRSKPIPRATFGIGGHLRGSEQDAPDPAATQYIGRRR